MHSEVVRLLKTPVKNLATYSYVLFEHLNRSPTNWKRTDKDDWNKNNTFCLNCSHTIMNKKVNYYLYLTVIRLVSGYLCLFPHSNLYRNVADHNSNLLLKKQ